MNGNPVTTGPLTDPPLLKVSPSSNVKDVAASIARLIPEGGGNIKIRAIGAGAVNQSVKAIAIASGMLMVRGLDLVCRPSFSTVDSVDGKISAIVFALHSQSV